MRLSRLQTLILWATFSLVLAEILYPPVELLQWSNWDNKWTNISLQEYTILAWRRGDDKRWERALERLGGRKFVLGHSQWRERNGDFKETSDVPRASIEVGAIAMIGVGLAYALRQRS